MNQAHAAVCCIVCGKLCEPTTRTVLGRPRHDRCAPLIRDDKHWTYVTNWRTDDPWEDQLDFSVFFASQEEAIAAARTDHQVSPDFTRAWTLYCSRPGLSREECDGACTRRCQCFYILDVELIDLPSNGDRYLNEDQVTKFR